MAKVVVTAQVEDLARWEEGFRTHGEMFRRQTVSRAIDFGMMEGNEVAVCVEPDDLDSFLETLESPETAAAMEFDGINRDTVKIYVLDKVFQP